MYYIKPECEVVALHPEQQILQISVGGSNQDYNGERNYDEEQGWN